VEAGDRFKRRGGRSHKFNVSGSLSTLTVPDTYVPLCVENRETLTVALSVLLEWKFFERVED